MLGRKKELVEPEMVFVGPPFKATMGLPGYQAYGSLAINEIWLPVDTEGLGISLFFFIYQLSLIHRVHALFHLRRILRCWVRRKLSIVYRFV